MIFFSKHGLEEDNNMNNIDNYSFMSNPYLEDSESDNPQKCCPNKFRTDMALLPFYMIDYSTALNSGLLEDHFLDKKNEIENLEEFDNVSNFFEKPKQNENDNVVIPIEENNNHKNKIKKPLGRPSKNSLYRKTFFKNS